MAGIQLTNPNRIIRAQKLLEFKESFSAELSGEFLHPVNVNSLTPSSTFVKNAVIGINGVLYRSIKATSNFPVTLTTNNGAFVVHTINGKIAFVVSDSTLNSDWEVFTDASIEYWVAQINASLGNKQDTIADLSTIRSNASDAVKKSDQYMVGNVAYSVTDLLQAVANLMNKTVVVRG